MDKGFTFSITYSPFPEVALLKGDDFVPVSMWMSLMPGDSRGYDDTLSIYLLEDFRFCLE
jgi:hypothetical protein